MRRFRVPSITLGSALRGWRLRRLASRRGAAYLRSLTWNEFVHQARERIFNVPVVVLSLLVVMALVHVVNEFVLSTEQQEHFLELFAFWPVRYDLRILSQYSWTLGWGAAVWTFVTYAFIHGNLMHLGFN